MAARPAALPWADREAFLAARDGDSARELEALLRDTFDLQAEFLLGRLEAALPAILAAVDPARRDVATGAARALLATPAGRYALIDYVNFKGTGLSPRERYQGEGWGLAQVLAAMPEDVDRSRVARAFADAAAAAMRGRVARAPPERNEARWLPGWLKRIDTYRR